MNLTDGLLPRQQGTAQMLWWLWFFTTLFKLPLTCCVCQERNDIIGQKAICNPKRPISKTVLSAVARQTVKSQWLDTRELHTWLILNPGASQLVLVVKNVPANASNPWVKKIPWRRAWQPTPVFLPGESHGQRSLGATAHEVTESQTQLKQLGVHTCLI